MLAIRIYLHVERDGFMDNIILPLIIAVIGSGAFSAIVSAIITAFNNRVKKKSSTIMGLSVLLEDRIDYVAGVYIKQGFILAADKDRLYRMWNVYHYDLGNNGFLDAKMHLVDELPVRIK